METENSQNVFSVSITHNSKIRELSDGNRVIICQTTFLLWVPPFLSYELWKLRIELWKLWIQTAPKCPKKNKIYTILISIQVYNSKLWVNFGLKKLRILKKSKLESCRYLSHGSNPSSLVSIGFLRREIRPKYWSVLKSDFSFSDSASLISFLIWSFQSWQSILALQLYLLRHLSMVL